MNIFEIKNVKNGQRTRELTDTKRPNCNSWFSDGNGATINVQVDNLYYMLGLSRLEVKELVAELVEFLNDTKIAARTRSSKDVSRKSKASRYQKGKDSRRNNGSKKEKGKGKSN